MPSRKRARSSAAAIKTSKSEKRIAGSTRTPENSNETAPEPPNALPAPEIPHMPTLPPSSTQNPMPPASSQTASPLTASYRVPVPAPGSVGTLPEFLDTTNLLKSHACQDPEPAAVAASMPNPYSLIAQSTPFERMHQPTILPPIGAQPINLTTRLSNMTVPNNLCLPQPYSLPQQQFHLHHLLGGHQIADSRIADLSRIGLPFGSSNPQSLFDSKKILEAVETGNRDESRSEFRLQSVVPGLAMRPQKDGHRHMQHIQPRLHALRGAAEHPDSSTDSRTATQSLVHATNASSLLPANPSNLSPAMLSLPPPPDAMPTQSESDTELEESPKQKCHPCVVAYPGYRASRRKDVELDDKAAHDRLPLEIGTGWFETINILAPKERSNCSANVKAEPQENNDNPTTPQQQSQKVKPPPKNASKSKRKPTRRSRHVSAPATTVPAQIPDTLEPTPSFPSKPAPPLPCSSQSDTQDIPGLLESTENTNSSNQPTYLLSEGMESFNFSTFQPKFANDGFDMDGSGRSVMTSVDCRVGEPLQYSSTPGVAYGCSYDMQHLAYSDQLNAQSNQVPLGPAVKVVERIGVGDGAVMASGQEPIRAFKNQPMVLVPMLQTPAAMRSGDIDATIHPSQKNAFMSLLPPAPPIQLDMADASLMLNVQPVIQPDLAMMPIPTVLVNDPQNIMARSRNVSVGASDPLLSAFPVIDPNIQAAAGLNDAPAPDQAGVVLDSISSQQSMTIPATLAESSPLDQDAHPYLPPLPRQLYQSHSDESEDTHVKRANLVSSQINLVETDPFADSQMQTLSPSLLPEQPQLVSIMSPESTDSDASDVCEAGMDVMSSATQSVATSISLSVSPMSFARQMQSSSKLSRGTAYLADADFNGVERDCDLDTAVTLGQHDVENARLASRQQVQVAKKRPKKDQEKDLENGENGSSGSHASVTSSSPTTPCSSSQIKPTATRGKSSRRRSGVSDIEAKRARNRIAARRSRQRKTDRIAELEKINADLCAQLEQIRERSADDKS